MNLAPSFKIIVPPVPQFKYFEKIRFKLHLKGKQRICDGIVLPEFEDTICADTFTRIDARPGVVKVAWRCGDIGISGTSRIPAAHCKPCHWVSLPQAWFDETLHQMRWDAVPADYEPVLNKNRTWRKVELAGHGKDPTRIQRSLLKSFDDAPLIEITTKRVLGGDQNLRARERDATYRYVKNHACGWIEIHQIKRERKKKDDQGRANIWTTKQYWLHWEEPGGKKRSRYIPKSKYAEVEESVYGLKAPLEETLKLLEKKT